MGHRPTRVSKTPGQGSISAIGILQQLSVRVYTTVNDLPMESATSLYAFVGLLAGDIALVLYLVLNALVVRATYLAAHVGEPERQVSVALQLGTIYVVCSFAGFLLVGVQVALLLPSQFVARWPWMVTIVVGALLGPPALFTILLVLGGGSVHL